MSQPTPIAIGTNAFGLPLFPNPRELYDLIMATIEPELISTSLPTLKKKYSRETLAESKRRAARYAKAFSQYDVAFQSYTKALQSVVHQYTHAAAKSLEAMIRTGEENDLKDLEDTFSREPSHTSHDA